LVLLGRTVAVGSTRSVRVGRGTTSVRVGLPLVAVGGGPAAVRVWPWVCGSRGVTVGGWPPGLPIDTRLQLMIPVEPVEPSGKSANTCNETSR
jgi:hypothetical protein